MPVFQNAFEALDSIKSSDRVFIHGAAATPGALIRGLVERAADLRQVEIIHLHTEGKAPYTALEMHDHFKIKNLYVGANMREKISFFYLIIFRAFCLRFRRFFEVDS